MLFKILKGPSSRISTDITPFHEGYAYVTEDGGDFYVDLMVEGKQKRVQINPDEIPAGGKDGQLLTKTATGWEWKDAPADGDMLASVYDPQGKHQDVFKYVDNAIKDVKVTTDATPTQGSANPVQSGGVYSALANKLDKTGNGSNVTAAFTAASTRANIVTGEKLSVLFGKIAKWFSDLGSLAFKSTVAKSDLASDVQTSLGKADSALQSAPVTSVNSKTGAVSLAKGDVGLGNVDNVKQYSANNPPPYPVTSVNGKTGAVTVNVPTVPSTTNLIKGNGSGGLVAATRGSDYIASGNIVKQTLVAAETTPTENYAINWYFGS